MNAKRSDDLHHIWLLTLGVCCLALLYLLRPILTPFLFAAIVAYICNPFVNWLESKKISRTVGTLTVLFLLATGTVLFGLILFPLIAKQLGLLGENLPGYLDWVRNNLPAWLKDHFGIDLQFDLSSLHSLLGDALQNGKQVAASLLPSLKSGSLAVIQFVTHLLLVPIVLFYLMRDWNTMISRIDEIIPRRWHPTASTLSRGIDQVLGEFLRGQLSVMLLMSLFYVIGLKWFAHLDYSLPIGMLAGLLVFIPYLGASVGMTLATLAGLVQFHDLSGLFPIWITFVIGQVAEGYLLVPWLVGDRIGLHPVVVIFALLAFGQLFGFFGVLLALPMSAALLVGVRMVRARYLDSSLYKAE